MVAIKKPLVKNKVTKAHILSSQQVAAEAAAAPPAGNLVPEGLPKSGRIWKTKQTERSSVTKYKGISAHLRLSFEERQAQKLKKEMMLEFEKELKDESKAKKDKKKEDLQEKRKRQAENELKSSVYQEINANKMKSMSKKQLRMIKKTAMDSKTGKIKLVDAYDGNHGLKKILGKKR